MLLSKLQRIERKGGAVTSRQPVVVHTAASGINRRKQAAAIDNQNAVGAVVWLHV